MVARFLIIAVAVMTALPVAIHANAELQGPIVVGGLFPLTGDLGWIGEEEKAATERAVSDFNMHPDRSVGGWTLDLLAADTATDADVALDALKELHGQGVNIVIADVASQTLLGLKPYVDENNMLVLACCSDATSVAVPGDDIYRMVPDNTQAGAALAHVINATGKKVLVQIWRDDTFAGGLERITSDLAAEMGIDSGGGVRYAPDSQSLGAEVAVLDKQVAEAIETYGAENVGVVMTAFDEGVEIFTRASLYEALTSVQWFAPETSMAYGDQLGAYQKMELMIIEEDSRQGHLYGYVSEFLEGANNNRAVYLMYDALGIITRSIQEAGSANVDDVGEVLPGVIDGYDGALVYHGLNENGDVSKADYKVNRLVNSTWQQIGYHWSGNSTTILDSDGN